jgi:hypothetical protein
MPNWCQIHERNGWTAHDMSLIHWTVLRQATGGMPSQMTQILKLSHDQKGGDK